MSWENLLYLTEFHIHSLHYNLAYFQDTSKHALGRKKIGFWNLKKKNFYPIHRGSMLKLAKWRTSIRTSATINLFLGWQRGLKILSFNSLVKLIILLVMSHTRCLFICPQGVLSHHLISNPMYTHIHRHTIANTQWGIQAGDTPTCKQHTQDPRQTAHTGGCT